MGRRALRKIDADLDLSWHLREFESLTAPFIATEMFQRDAPLEVEVGCGKGLFMSTASGDLPDRNFVGIEIASKYASFAAARLAKSERDNALLIHGDAQKFFHDYLPLESLDAVHVYFPGGEQRFQEQTTLKPTSTSMHLVLRSRPCRSP